MALFSACMFLVFFVTLWAAYIDWFGADIAWLLVKIELVILVAAVIWSLISLTGPHTAYGKKRRKRQDQDRYDRAVKKDSKDFGSHH